MVARRVLEMEGLEVAVSWRGVMRNPANVVFGAYLWTGLRDSLAMSLLVVRISGVLLLWLGC